MKKVFYFPIIAILLLSVFLWAGNTIDGRLIMSIISGGGITGSIDPPIWDDMRVPMTSTKVKGTAKDAEFIVFQDDLATTAFKKSDEREVYFNIQLSHRYKFGTDLEAHIHWSPGSSVDTGDVRWCLEYSVANIGDNFPASTTTCVLQAPSGVAYKHEYTDLVSIDGSGINIVSAMIIFRLFRDGGHEDDDFDDYAYVFEFDLHVQMDSFGSDQEAAKN